MGDREDILAALRANKPALLPLPEINPPAQSDASPESQFKQIVVEIGAKLVEANRDAVDAALESVYPGMTPVFVEDLSAQADLSAMDLFVCEGEIGVAENGAIWVPERRAVRRVAPFIAQHMAIVLDRQNIVENMHAAYAAIDVDRDGFGVFIAGPSKTADIEQSLVLGAHGPRSLTVVLVDA